MQAGRHALATPQRRLRVRRPGRHPLQHLLGHL